MVFDSLKDRMGGHDNLTPMQVAHNTLFTAREKLDLLHQLKADVATGQEDGTDFGFTPEEVDEAIAEVRQGVQDGVTLGTVVKGDF